MKNKLFSALLFALTLGVTSVCAQPHQTYQGAFSLNEKYKGTATYTYFETEDARIYDGAFEFKSNYVPKSLTTNRPYEIKGMFKNNLRDGAWYELFDEHAEDNPTIYQLNYTAGKLDGTFQVIRRGLTLTGTVRENRLVDSLICYAGKNDQNYEKYSCWFNNNGRVEGKWTVIKVRSSVVVWRQITNFWGGLALDETTIDETNGERTKAVYCTPEQLTYIQHYYHPETDLNQWNDGKTLYTFESAEFNIGIPVNLRSTLLLGYRYKKGMDMELAPCIFTLHNRRL